MCLQSLKPKAHIQTGFYIHFYKWKIISHKYGITNRAKLKNKIKKTQKKQ